jgi:hypothetical protein
VYLKIGRRSTGLSGIYGEDEKVSDGHKNE